MLTQLSIRNFTLIEQLDLELDSGMTVISGETGAGKSIMLDALGLTLGDRADADMIRHGCDRADISACFDINDLPLAQQWLQQQDLDNDNDCLLRRVVNRNGRSRAYINGHPTPLQDLRKLGEFLIDIHGQHEHQSLLKKEQHQILLDNYGGHRDLTEDVRQQFQQWQQLANQLRQIREQSDEQRAQLQLLSYQVEELDQLSPEAGEPTQLEQEQKQLASAGQLLQSGELVRQISTEDETTNCRQLLNQCLQQLSQFDLNNEQWLGVQEMLNTALIQVEEASAELEHYLSRVEIDPQRLEWVEERLSSLYEIARKHQIEPDQLPELHQTLADQLATQSLSDDALEQLQQQVDSAEQQYVQLAEKLSQQRVNAADTLNQKINQQLHALGMSTSNFVANLTPQSAAAQGMEAIEFLISTNPGQPPKPLAKVASGGELSRISLAIQVVTAQTSATPVLAFDEVDVGIGGAVAEVVGRLLRELGQHSQIICVTHQPQVACCGHQHLRVSKAQQDQHNVSQIQALETDQRVKEVARMLGGIDITERTLDHAREMLEMA
ncbi:MAG: DNA repair protein RecN [Motiliproteus sp.]|nr:DNA repair protein RecN [Motiliproteus sp.]MCW9052601.1 DNA repair protein RecN [Motiliproteus sp.]